METIDINQEIYDYCIKLLLQPPRRIFVKENPATRMLICSMETFEMEYYALKIPKKMLSESDKEKYYHD